MIDASIYGQIQAPKQTNRLAQFAQMQQLESAQSQNRLAELSFSEKEREIASARAMDDVYKNATGPDGKTDRQKVLAGIAQTQGSKLPAIQKGFAETDKAEVEAEKNKITLQRDKLSLAGQILGPVKDQASYDVARQTAAANGLDVSKMPPQYDPGFVAARLKESLSAKEQLEQHWKVKGYDLDVQKVAETGRHNKATETGAADGRQLTDTRARDFNDTKVEENRIKLAANKGEFAKLTEDQGKATGWLVQADNAYKNMMAVGADKDGDPTSAARPGFNDALAAIPSFGLTSGVANTMRGADRQKFIQAASSLSESLLRAATGAGVNRDEAEQKIKELTPQFGEAAETTKQKYAAIPLYIESLKVRAGPGASRAAGISGNAGGASTPDAGSRDTTVSWGDPQAQRAPVSIKNAADYANVPSGATYIDPNGKTRTKK